MSGTGKSHWSRRLAREHGLHRMCIDDMIEEKLGPELKKGGFSGGIKDVASWMGLPYEARSSSRQSEYLVCETGETAQAVRSLSDLSKPVVIDCTGSIVHTDAEVRHELTRRTTVVYLETPESRHQEMLRIFLADPKPVIWGEYYAPRPGEVTDQAIARCYPILLAERSKIYRQLASVTIPWEVHRNPAFTTNDLLECAEQAGFDRSLLQKDGQLPLIAWVGETYFDETH